MHIQYLIVFDNAHFKTYRIKADSGGFPHLGQTQWSIRYRMDHQKRPGVNPQVWGGYTSKSKKPQGFAPQKDVNPPLSACRILIKGVNTPGVTHPPRLIFGI